MKNVLKRLTGFALAAIMVVGMNAMAFAQTAPGYVTFFKEGSTSAVSMTQNVIESYASKVQVGDNYVYTINLQSFEMTKMGISGEGTMTGIALGAAALNAGVTASLTNGGDTLVVSVPTSLVVNGNSPAFAADVEATVEIFWGIEFDMPSAVNLAITDTELTYSE